MIEVRSSYLVKMKDVNDAAALWRECRDRIWPTLQWSGRIQQMIHGSAQQSMFVWSSEWESMAAWEAGMARTTESTEYKEWSAAMNQFRVYGSEREVFSILAPATPPDCTPGRLEVRSSYLVQVQRVKDAQAIMRRGQETIWPLLGWSGQNQQMLHGKASQSMFVWSSVWENLGTWEKAMASTGGPEFQAWFRDWREVVDFGGPREVFRSL